jgi:hypothetical protein
MDPLLRDTPAVKNSKDQRPFSSSISHPGARGEAGRAFDIKHSGR